MEYGSALRHRDYRSCLIGSLARWFFWRWMCDGEPFPTFRTSEGWYYTKMIRRDAQHLVEQLSDSTASGHTKKLMTDVGIKSTHITHAPRMSGPKIAEQNGASEAQVRLLLWPRCYYN